MLITLEKYRTNQKCVIVKDANDPLSFSLTNIQYLINFMPKKFLRIVGNAIIQVP